MKYIFCVFCILFLTPNITGQERDEISILFWNLENHFHPENDSLTRDDEFTPEGERYYGFNRYWSKNARLWKTIISAGTPHPPEIIALAEVENEIVVNDLFVFSPPGIYDYKRIHKDSDDWRGIDLALLYDDNRLTLLRYNFVKIDTESMGGSPTRDILYSSFLIQDDTLNIFINHWPSKYGGVGVTDKFRMKAAETLLKSIDTLLYSYPDAKIAVLGDFNDITASNCLNFLLSSQILKKVDLVSERVQGTIKYQGRWEYIDHVFLTETLMEKKGALKYEKSIIYSPEYLLEPDQKYGGFKPFRTWNGYKYQEGFSDHLPIILTLKCPTQD